MKTYEFYGIATVSVQCFIEANSAEEARAKLASGDHQWECESVDGDVSDIELVTDDEDEEDD